MPQEIALYNELSAWENLMFWGSMYGVPKKELLIRANDLLAHFGLEDRKNDAIKNYSGGMKRRINIAAALLHRPEILFMDEPTVGIDPQSRNLIFEVVEKLHRDGMTIVYTTHYMEEAERFCDRIGIIDNGQIIAEGTLDELKKSTQIKETIALTPADYNPAKMNQLEHFWPDHSRTKNTIYLYSADIKTDLSKIVLECSRIGLEIANIEIIKTNLETVFLNLTGEQLRD